MPGRNGSFEGAIEPAPSAAEGKNNATVQELAKITGCDWQLCVQALQACPDDPNRCVHQT